MVSKKSDEILKGRLEKVRQHLSTLSINGVLIEHPAHLLYLTGMEFSVGKILITLKEMCLIVDGRYIETASKQTVYPVVLLKENALENQIEAFSISKLGFDKQQSSYQGFLSLSQLAVDLYKKSYALEIMPIDSIIQELRLIKEPDEIDALRKAARLGYQGYEFVLSLLRENVTEAELAFELEFFWKKRGGSRLAFDSIIAFGPNSSMPHYRASSTPLQKNTSVLIDIGVVLSHYHSDMTRVVFFGEPPSKIKEIYQIVEEAKGQAFSLCKPGTLVGDLDKIARDWIQSKGYGEFFNHSLGHGIGLDIHEPPILKSSGPYHSFPLKPGMVITIEPGIYLPGVGGVRLEDTILITETGFENLTHVPFT